MSYIGYVPAAKPLTSADITDGIIVNADINANAAIASSKLSITSPLSITGNSTAGSEIRLPEDTDNGSNYVALKAPNTLSSDLTFTLPSADGSANQALITNGSGSLSFATVGATAGQVIQVVTATDSTQRSTTSTSFVTGSNTLSASITPSATANKIFVIVNTTVRSESAGWLTVYRGATDLGAASNNGLCRFYGENANMVPEYPAGISILDSPSTTSSTTYQVYFRGDGSPNHINYGSVKASITLFEIKG